MSEQEWEQLLYRFTLDPSDSVMRYAEAVIHKLNKILRKTTRYSVDRVEMVGRPVKNPANSQQKFCINCIAYVNNLTQHNLSYILYTFKSQLQCHGYSCELGKSKLVLKATRRKLDIQIIPSLNPSEDLTQLQKAWDDTSAGSYTSTVEKIRYYRSLSMSKEIEFMKSQSWYVQDLVHIAKCWSRKIPHYDERNEWPTIFELIAERNKWPNIFQLIAVEAGNLEEKVGSTSLYRGYHRFLEMMQHFSTLEVVFDKFYSVSDIPADMWLRHPVVVNPCNPCENLARDVTYFIKGIESFAANTLGKMAKGKADTSAADLD